MSKREEELAQEIQRLLGVLSEKRTEAELRGKIALGYRHRLEAAEAEIRRLTEALSGAQMRLPSQ